MGNYGPASSRRCARSPGRVHGLLGPFGRDRALLGAGGDLCWTWRARSRLLPTGAAWQGRGGAQSAVYAEATGRGGGDGSGPTVARLTRGGAAAAARAVGREGEIDCENQIPHRPAPRSLEVGAGGRRRRPSPRGAERRPPRQAGAACRAERRGKLRETAREEDRLCHKRQLFGDQSAMDRIGRTCRQLPKEKLKGLGETGSGNVVNEPSCWVTKRPSRSQVAR